MSTARRCGPTWPAALIEHEQIKTTLPKAKELRRVVDKLITLAKRGDLHARRQAAAQLKQDGHVAKLFDVLGPRYAERPGGYVRVLKAGFRYGDMAPMAIVELVDRDPEAKGKADRERVKCDISPGFVIALMKRYCTTVSLEPARQGRPPGGQLTPPKGHLVRTVEARPDITMPERAELLDAEHGVRADPSCLSRRLIKLWFSYRKIVACGGVRTRPGPA
jgi:large subunit ribosomal protein L17